MYNSVYLILRVYFKQKLSWLVISKIISPKLTILSPKKDQFILSFI